MSRSILHSLLVACVVVSARAQDPGDVFKQGNQLYQEGKFAEAQDAYESLVKNGYGGGTLYYNLGNAYYKTGDVGRAILFYERALRLTPGDDDLRHNLRLANTVLIDKIEPTPRLFIWDYWDVVKQSLSVPSLMWLAYAFYVLTLGAFAFLILARTYRLRKVGLVSGLVSGAVMAILIVILTARLSDLEKKDSAIVTVQIATVKNSPDSKSSDAFVLHAGAKVQITDRLSDWVQVRLADGKVGWMERSAAEVI